MRYDPPNVPEMTGADLKLSGTRQDFDTRTNQPIVTMQFTDSGAKKFDEITRAEAQRGKLLSNTVGGGQKIEQHFAIVLDREIRSWPSIDWEEYPGGISGSNGAQISGRFTVKEAKDLALVLQTGALPVEFVTLDQTAISATLGKDSLERGQDGGDRGTDPRRALPARLLPLPRGSSRYSGSASTRRSSTRRSSSSTSR